MSSVLDDHSQKYLALVYRYLTIRNRSEKEVRDYLIKKQAEPHIIDSLIVLLYEQNLLDDETFARSWIRARARTRPRGKRLLEIELQQKGIEKALIEKVLAEEDEELPDELTQAKQLIRKRVEKLQDASRQDVYQKVGAFLARRGYSWEIIKRAIDDSLKNKV